MHCGQDAPQHVRWDGIRMPADALTGCIQLVRWQALSAIPPPAPRQVPALGLLQLARHLPRTGRQQCKRLITTLHTAS